MLNLICNPKVYHLFSERDLIDVFTSKQSYAPKMVRGVSNYLFVTQFQYLLLSSLNTIKARYSYWIFLWKEKVIKLYWKEELFSLEILRDIN